MSSRRNRGSGSGNGSNSSPSVRADLLDLSRHLRQERLFVNHEKAQLEQVGQWTNGTGQHCKIAKLAFNIYVVFSNKGCPSGSKVVGMSGPLNWVL